MRLHHLGRSRTVPVAAAAAALFAVGVFPATASATPRASHATKCERAHQAKTCDQTQYRQLLGTVTDSTYLEASVPTAGSYAIEYDVTAPNAAFFDTYVNGTELGYVGGATGTYVTRAVQLPAGGQLVQVVGPEGSGTADVYIVSVPAT